MEKQSTQSPLNPLVSQEADAVPIQSKPKTSPIVPILIFLLLLTSVTTAYFYRQTQVLQNNTFDQQAPPQPTPAPKSSVPNIPSDWTIFQSPELGITFHYPPSFQPLDYPNGHETPGEKGQQYCTSFTLFKETSFLHFISQAYAGSGSCAGTFSIGATSKNYSAGREGGFGDYQGYVKENNSFYAKFVGSQKLAIPSDLTKEISTPEGISILIVTGRNETGQNGEFFIPGTPGKGLIGALVNIDNNPVYTGFNIQMKLDNQHTPELFSQILSTLKLSNTTPSKEVGDSRTQDIADFIKAITYNMSWRTLVRDSAENFNGESLTGLSMTTVTLPKGEDQIMPLFASTSTLTEAYGWPSPEIADGVNMSRAQFQVDDKLVIISSNYTNQTHTVFIQD